MEKNLADPVFMITTLDEAMIHIVAHGRGAAGADPPEAFQVFLNGYIPFWNEDDQGCDTVTWETVAPYKAYLTTTVRKRMNDIVRKLNEQLALAAERLSGEGVFYIDGYQDSYKGHQFCEPGSHLDNPISKETWFWCFNR